MHGYVNMISELTTDVRDLISLVHFTLVFPHGGACPSWCYKLGLLERSTEDFHDTVGVFMVVNRAVEGGIMIRILHTYIMHNVCTCVG